MHDCVVLPRGAGLVVYLVPTGQILNDDLFERLRSRLPPSDATVLEFVPVSRIPLDQQGEPDEPALLAMPVVDEELLNRWKRALESASGISRAAVVERPRSVEPARIHVANLNAPGDSGSGQPPPGGERPAATVPGEPRFTSGRRPAISHGGSLPREEAPPTSLGEALARAADEHPEAGVTYILESGSELTQSYPDLLEEAQRILGGLCEAGVRPRDKVLLQLGSNHDFLPAFWAVVLGGAVPVPVSIAPSYTAANATAQKLANAWTLLGRPPVLTSGALTTPLRELARELELGEFRLLDVESLRSARKASPLSSTPDELALLLLTSGSTGVPKAVMHNHRTILSRPPSTALVNGFTSRDVTLNWMPLDHVVGLVMFHLRDVYLGCRQIHAPASLVLQDPLRWLDWMERFRVTVTWAPNFAYALVNERAPEIGRRSWDLSSVKCILNGAEAIVPRTARRYMELLIPKGLSASAMRPGWGMSETSSGVCFSQRFSLETTSDDDPFVDLGTPIPGTSIRFVDEDNRLVDEEVVGRLQVHGSTVSPGYYENPDLNREVFTEDGWFATGDLGFMKEGRLTLTGREKAEIIINGINYVGPEIEAVVEDVEGVAVSFTAVCGVRPRGFDTDALVVFFHTPVAEAAGRREVLKAIRRRVAESMGIAPAFLVPLEKSDVPKTETGKIQRLQLKRRFEEGRFDEQVQEADLLMANDRTLPSWFYQRVWRRRMLAVSSLHPERLRTLVLADGTEIGAAVYEKLVGDGTPAVWLEAGDAFTRCGPGHLRLNLDEETDYRKALEAAAGEIGGIDRIVYLESPPPPSSQEAGSPRLGRGALRSAARVLWLIRALHATQGESPVRLVAVTRGAQRVSKQDEIDCHASPLLSIGTTLPQELPWVKATLVDLAPGLETPKEVAGVLLGELASLQAEPEVAYRDGRRLVSRLEPAKLEPAADRRPPLRRGGFYVLSGGLGGVGVELARELLTRFEARLLILGRTVLPEGESGDHEVTGVEAALHELEALPGEVIYATADVADERAVEHAVAGARERWGRLDGVFHLAGTYHETSLLEESEGSLSRVMLPKVEGTLVLHHLVEDDPDAIFVGFSSLGAYFGAAGVGAYSAANRFLSDLCGELDRRSPARCFCFDWSTWNELGLSSRHVVRGLDRLRGYHPLDREEAIRSLLAALTADERSLVIGLDGGHEFVRNRSLGPLYPLTTITGYYVADGNAPAELAALRIVDRFGAPTTCELVERAELPLLPSGEIDASALATEGDGGADASGAAPTGTERLIEGFWKEVLEVPRVELDDDFFALGGDSILATRLLARLQSAFPVEVTLRTVFENPTVRRLAAQLDGTVTTEKKLETIEREDAGALLARIGEISDDEVSEQLARMLREREKER